MKLSGGGYLKGYHAKADRTCGKERLADIGQPTKEAYFLTDDCKKYLDDYLSYCKNVGLENVLFVQPPHETEAITKTGIEQMESIINQYGYDFVDLSTDYSRKARTVSAAAYGADTTIYAAGTYWEMQDYRARKQ